MHVFRISKLLDGECCIFGFSQSAVMSARFKVHFQLFPIFPFTGVAFSSVDFFFSSIFFLSHDTSLPRVTDRVALVHISFRMLHQLNEKQQILDAIWSRVSTRILGSFIYG